MKHPGTALEVFKTFLVLGLTSFGGPVAHLGYFRRAFVAEKKWLDEAEYAGIVGLCQFLPGPASSQTGFCIGLQRAGWLGGLAAWVGFTLPSALIMFGFAAYGGLFAHSAWAGHALHGLQLAAVAVVAQAVWVMAKGLCPDWPRRALALLALGVMVAAPGSAGQMVVLLGGAAAGLVLCKPPAATANEPDKILSRRAGAVCLVLFFVLLAVAFIPFAAHLPALAAAFYRTGALVFGGGHVVLPLLHDAIVAPGWVPAPQFLAGYGLAQAMPGPLFTVAAFLGAVSFGGSGVAGAAAALAGIFLPGLLLAAGVLPFWHQLRRNAGLAAALMGVNAAVVGLLGYALLSLVFAGTIGHWFDAVIALAALLALILLRAPPILVVAGCAAAAMVF
jgi:chromate transporter